LIFFCSSFATVCKKILRPSEENLPEIEPTAAASVFGSSRFTVKRRLKIHHRDKEHVEFGVLLDENFYSAPSAVRFPNLSSPHSDRRLSYDLDLRRLDV
jgi:peroxiredoxin